MIEVNATEIGLWTKESLLAILAWLEYEGIDPRNVAGFTYDHPNLTVTHFRLRNGDRYIAKGGNTAAVHTVRYTVASTMPQLVYRHPPPQSTS